MLNENVSAKHLKTYNKVEAATINLVFMGEKILRYIKDHMAGAYVYLCITIFMWQTSFY